MKKHPGQLSRKDTVIPKSPKSYLPNSRVRGRKDTSGTVTDGFLNHQSLPAPKQSFLREEKKLISFSHLTQGQSSLLHLGDEALHWLGATLVLMKS